MIEKKEKKYLFMIIIITIYSLIWLLYTVFSNWNTVDSLNECYKAGYTDCEYRIK